MKSETKLTRYLGLTVGIFASGAALNQGHAQSLSFAAPLNLNAGGIQGGASSSEAANLDSDPEMEFISTASGGGRGSIDAHFRIYDWNKNTNSFNVINVRTADFIRQTKMDRFAGDIATGLINNDAFPDIIVPNSKTGEGGGSVCLV